MANIINARKPITDREIETIEIVILALIDFLKSVKLFDISLTNPEFSFISIEKSDKSFFTLSAIF